MIFIENNEGKFLMQKASSQKDGMFAATGGHVTTGETPHSTIIREVKEELGIDISKDDNIIYLGNVILGVPIRQEQLRPSNKLVLEKVMEYKRNM